ncbi:MAG: IS200/IS605 family transposase [Chitinophagaceae bacterium]|nr:IS200/IS605 family transposase [Chitinophagaceae bacterium]
MANTYSQITIHGVFAVKQRENLLVKPWRDEVHKYISGILNKMNCMPLAVNGWLDHVHTVFAMPLTICIADVMETVKSNSSKWINDRRFVKGQFRWQSGYAAFSMSKSHRDNGIKYVMNQEEHHRKITFKEEYEKLLDLHEVDWDSRYVFEYYDLP